MTAAALGGAAGGGDVKVHPIAGELTFETVAKVDAATAPVFAASDAVTLDLAGVTRADSAGLALIIGWVRRAQRQNKTLRLKNVPEKLLAIARVTGVEPFLPLA